MGLRNVWIRTLGDGLVRADQVTGIDSHRTPALTGKPSRWLLDVTLTVPAGSGNADGWDVAELHRTLAQTDWQPTRAPEELAGLLHRLRRAKVAGVVRVVPRDGHIQFDFTPFDAAEQDTGDTLPSAEQVRSGS
ncbi:hypothetical protein [Qaidamihabitans albus]|uniref:hypothetical protein n=1 Tax=Qaidamihabitans albus TaxID=2795733 RepID=UPI0018F1E4CF|nr:hypothetical protein [Qaidamihabitans albus]